jgi:SAM-dependent methyltransferase
MKNYCNLCKNKEIKKFLSFDKQPLANQFSYVKIKKKFPLELCFCKKCKNCQLSYFVNPKKLFSNYYYMSSVSMTTQKHISKSVKKFSKKFFLSKKDSCIIDVGSNDGLALIELKKIGFKKVIGIEPAKNLMLISKKKGLNVINSFLDKKLSTKLKNKADVVLASNVFAHTDRVNNLFSNILEITKDSGIIIIEIQYLYFTIKNLSFDNIYHEHYHYWTLISLSNFIKNFNATIVDVEILSTHGGSLRIYIKKGILKSSNKYYRLIANEKSFGLDKTFIYKLFAKNVHNKLKKIKKKFELYNKKYTTIVGYGAPAKSTLLVNKLKLEDFIDFFVDNNKIKQGKFLSGTNLVVQNPKKLFKFSNVLIIVFAWNYFNEIKLLFKKSSHKLISIRSLY